MFFFHMHLSEAIRKWLYKAYIIEVVWSSEYNSLKFRSDNPLLVRHLSYVIMSWSCNRVVVNIPLHANDPRNTIHI